MNKKTLLIFILIFIIFCFFVFLRSLNNSNTYVPNEGSGKKISTFNAKNFFNNDIIISDNLFVENKIYILNIWASWCMPCRVEHKYLMHLSKNPSIKMIGLNYRDDLTKAKKFINKFGNPYSEILIDKDGTISIALGAYGIPETLVIDNNKKILRKFVGSLNDQSIKEIESLLK